MRISDWSSDVCSSDLHAHHALVEYQCGRADDRREGRRAHPRGGGMRPLQTYIGNPGEDRVAQIVERCEKAISRGLEWLAGRRSEERRVGNECVSTCSSRWLAVH